MTDEKQVTDALSNLGSDHSPPPGWQRRVLAAVQPRRRLADWFLAAVVVAVAIGAAMLLTYWML